MTATPYTNSFERHDVVSPHRPSASGTRGDTSSPHAYAQPPKRNAENMQHRHPAKQAPSSRHPAERLDCPSRPRDPARTTGSSETRQEGRYFLRQPPTPPWLQRPSHEPFPSASAPSLSGSMRFNNPTATSSLNGAFSGAWPSARPSPAYGMTPMNGAWTHTRESSDSGMDGDENASTSDDPRATHSAFPPIRSESFRDLPRLPALTESDLALGASSRSTSQPDSTESVRLPPVRAYTPQRASADHSPYSRPLPPAKRACVRLPSFPAVWDFVHGKSSTLSDDIVSCSARGGTTSPPPSPSPSAASVSTNAYSGSQTDTEPTEDDDVSMGYAKRYGSFSPRPPAQSMRPATIPRELEPARPSTPLDEVVHSPLPTPLPADAFARVPRAPPTPTARSPRKGEGKETPAEASKPRRRARGRAAESKVPPQKKYRFVASHLSGDVSQLPGTTEDVERGRFACEQSGSKRKHTASPAPSSSPDIPPSTLVPRSSARLPSNAAQPTAGPSSRRQSQPHARAPTHPPKRRGRPPRPAYDIESVAPIDPDSPEGQGQFPVYSYRDEERPTPCQFPGCETLLTGKKAETTSHLKEHFQEAGDRMLLCPWEMTRDSGECVPCDKTFKDSANMGRHVATKHLQLEKYKCGKCLREFARRDAALRHMKTMCSPEKEQRRAAKRKAGTDEESEDGANDGDNSGSSSSREE